MRDLMAGLVDQDGGHIERWRWMAGAGTAIVWDTRLGGLPIALIGIEGQNIPRERPAPPDGAPHWTAGTLFPASSKKVARALRAASGVRPAVVLANLSGFDGSPESMQSLQLELGAEIASAVVNFRGPIWFVVVTRYHGGAYVVFSRELNPELRALALEGAFASVIGGQAAARVVFTREVETRTKFRGRGCADENLRRVVQAEIAADYDAIHSIERAKEVGSIEAIIPPRKLRPILISGLRQSAAPSTREGRSLQQEVPGQTSPDPPGAPRSRRQTSADTPCGPSSMPK